MANVLPFIVSLIQISKLYIENINPPPHFFTIFVAFVDDNATVSSIPYYENHVRYVVQKPKEADPINLNFCMTNKCFEALKCMLKDEILKSNGLGH